MSGLGEAPFLIQNVRRKSLTAGVCEEAHCLALMTACRWWAGRAEILLFLLNLERHVRGRGIRQREFQEVEGTEPVGSATSRERTGTHPLGSLKISETTYIESPVL